MSALSADEAACVRDAIGEATFSVIQDVALSTLPTDTPALPFECLTAENAIGINIAFMSAEAGGLSAEGRACIRDIALANPGVLGIGTPPEDPATAMGAAIRMQLCLSDEKAAALAGSGDAGLPAPSAMRCMEDQLGGLDAFLSVFTSEEPDVDVVFRLFAAAQECGADLASGGAGG